MTEKQWLSEPVWELLQYASKEIPTVPSQWLKVLLSSQGSPPPTTQLRKIGFRGRKHWLLMLSITRLYWDHLSDKSREFVEWLQQNEELPTPPNGSSLSDLSSDTLSDRLEADAAIAPESARLKGMEEASGLSGYLWTDLYTEYRWEPDRIESWRPLVYDIFGNPFWPVSFNEEWRTSTIVALAQQMYASRDFSEMPILADSLQDAGCDNADILSHCRDPQQVHVRGCWVVDLVLGKQ
jgi:hypothetical protein